MKAQTNRKTFEDMSANAKQEMNTWEAQRVKVNIFKLAGTIKKFSAKEAKVAFFLKDTNKYFEKVEAQTWYHQTVFCIVYLTKIPTTKFFTYTMQKTV